MKKFLDLKRSIVNSKNQPSLLQTYLDTIRSSCYKLAAPHLQQNSCNQQNDNNNIAGKGAYGCADKSIVKNIFGNSNKCVSNHGASELIGFDLTISQQYTHDNVSSMGTTHTNTNNTNTNKNINKNLKDKLQNRISQEKQSQQRFTPNLQKYPQSKQPSINATNKNKHKSRKDNTTPNNFSPNLTPTQRQDQNQHNLQSKQKNDRNPHNPPTSSSISKQIQQIFQTLSSQCRSYTQSQMPSNSNTHRQASSNNSSHIDAEVDTNTNVYANVDQNICAQNKISQKQIISIILNNLQILNKKKQYEQSVKLIKSIILNIDVNNVNGHPNITDNNKKVQIQTKHDKQNTQISNKPTHTHAHTHPHAYTKADKYPKKQIQRILQSDKFIDNNSQIKQMSYIMQSPSADRQPQSQANSHFKSCMQYQDQKQKQVKISENDNLDTNSAAMTKSISNLPILSQTLMQNQKQRSHTHTETSQSYQNYKQKQKLTSKYSDKHQQQLNQQLIRSTNECNYQDLHVQQAHHHNTNPDPKPQKPINNPINTKLVKYTVHRDPKKYQGSSIYIQDQYIPDSQQQQPQEQCVGQNTARYGRQSPIKAQQASNNYQQYLQQQQQQQEYSNNTNPTHQLSCIQQQQQQYYKSSSVSSVVPDQTIEFKKIIYMLDSGSTNKKEHQDQQQDDYQYRSYQGYPGLSSNSIGGEVSSQQYNILDVNMHMHENIAIHNRSKQLKTQKSKACSNKSARSLFSPVPIQSQPHPQTQPDKQHDRSNSMNTSSNINISSQHISADYDNHYDNDYDNDDDPGDNNGQQQYQQQQQQYYKQQSHNPYNYNNADSADNQFLDIHAQTQKQASLFDVQQKQDIHNTPLFDTHTPNNNNNNNNNSNNNNINNTKINNNKTKNHNHNHKSNKIINWNTNTHANNNKSTSNNSKKINSSHNNFVNVDNASTNGNKTKYLFVRKDKAKNARPSKQKHQHQKEKQKQKEKSTEMSLLLQQKQPISSIQDNSNSIHQPQKQKPKIYKTQLLKTKKNVIAASSARPVRFIQNQTIKLRQNYNSMLALSMNNTNIMNSYMNTTIGLKNSNKYKNDKNVNVNQSMTNIPTTNNTNTTNTNNYASTNNPTTTTTKPDKSKQLKQIVNMLSNKYNRTIKLGKV